MGLRSETRVRNSRCRCAETSQDTTAFRPDQRMYVLVPGHPPLYFPILSLCRSTWEESESGQNSPNQRHSREKGVRKRGEGLHVRWDPVLTTSCLPSQVRQCRALYKTVLREGPVGVRQGFGGERGVVKAAYCHRSGLWSSATRQLYNSRAVFHPRTHAGRTHVQLRETTMSEVCLSTI